MGIIDDGKYILSSLVHMLDVPVYGVAYLEMVSIVVGPFLRYKAAKM